MRELGDRRERDQRRARRRSAPRARPSAAPATRTGRPRTRTPTITRNAPNTPPAPISSAPPNRTADDPLQPIRDGREPEDRVRQGVRRGDRLLDDPAVGDQHDRRPTHSARRRRRVRRAGQTHHPVAQRADRQRDGQQRHRRDRSCRPAAALTCLQLAGSGSATRCWIVATVPCLSQPGTSAPASAPKNPLAIAFDDAVKRRQPEKRQRHERTPRARR